MTFQIFPVLSVDSNARCFECDGSLVDPKDSGYEPGCGARLAWCLECKKSTFYDLAHALRAGKKVGKEEGA